ncbi:aldehyde oxidase 1 [Salmo salar]|uniref:aldehyde oxidase n=1 Tax=Salmo salar TaxID=8030 RepID=A0A1S3MVD4_SALSA|nr:aldehyde oxidase 1 [Salmo salar]|eukprot:XP_014007070.1 PREDICTED: aldehyde oxidase 1-like [Salmo salar]
MSENKETDCLCFYVNGKKVTENNADPETMLLSYLRERLRLTGTKYGCGGGGCGACTVMVSRYQPGTKTILHYSANACLLPVCQLQGAAVTTVEGIGNTKTRVHPVQERIAKAHGSQCGFCTPGMVMSMYTLLRNKPQPNMEDITVALGGNLCRCTGYRPIVDGCKTFSPESNCCQANGNGAGCCLNGESSPERSENELPPQLFDQEDLLPLDPTQDLIFPPELILMAETEPQVSQLFRGERMVWVSPVSLEELIQLKTSHPQAPLVMGNTNIGPDIKFKGAWHPIIISPTRVQELFEVTKTPQGVCIGAGCSLSVVKALLEGLVQEIPEEKTEIYRSLLQQLGNLGGQQIRNVASIGGNIVSAYPNSDLNPVFAAGNCTLNVVSKRGRQEILLNKDFFVGFGKTSLKPDEIVLSVFIPVSRQGEFMRAFRQAPRKENALATVTTGMRVMFTEGSSVVKELSIYYGGVGPCTVSATKTCAAVIGRKWDEQTLSEAYTQLLDEISLSPSHPGGQVEFRRSLTLSLLFKFNLQMLHKLWEMNVIQEDLSEEMSSGIRPLPKQLQPSLQEFQAVVKGQSGDDPVGRPIMHRSAISQATGEAVYCDDIPKMDGELHIVLVTSTRPHAKILDIDISEALQVPGVVDVITSKDIPGKKFRTFTGIDEDILAQNEVSCVGHMVCAVVADTRKQAKRGAALVKIGYEDLPGPVFTVEEAIEKQSFFLPQRMIERGNVDVAFDKVDHVYEGEIRLGGQEHFYMETQSMVVVPSGEDRELKVYLSCQHPTYTQESIAETLGIPSNRVSCHVKRVGGAFGGKVTKTSIIACITSVAAWKTGRAVRCVLERGEDMLITGARHPVLGKHKVGFMNDGRIMAADLHYYANSGNTADESLLVIEKILLHLDNAYNVPNLRGRSVACKTNLPSNTAFRGFGVPQSMLVTENMINDVAMKLGCNAEEIREINMYKEVSLTHYKFEFDPKNLLRCWDECKEKSDYGSRRKSIAQFNQQNRWKKRGMATIPIKYGIAFSDGFLNQAASLVHIYKDGSVLVSHGGTEMGQGIHTKMQQVASRELHIPASLIHITETNTSAVPNTCPSAASFGTDANGMAVKDACETLYQRLEPVRKQNPEGTWQTWVNSAFIQKISLSATGYYRGHDLHMDWEKQEGRPYAYYTYGACCSEVEVDCLTGDYRTVRTDIVMDIGRSINPSVDIGQIEGAFIQGLGLYTMEELKFSPSGVLYTRGPSQYKIPAVCDIPLQFNVYLLSGSDNPHAIYSSKGIGEPVLFLGSSVFFAIKDAVAAARVEAGMVGPFTLNSPATPERTCLACNTTFTQKIPASKQGSFQPWALNIP